MSITDADRAGWHEALIHFPYGEPHFKRVQGILEELGYYRPRNRWEWDKQEVTYMRSVDDYYLTKLRYKEPEGEEEE